jgi:hypothetical protein
MPYDTAEALVVSLQGSRFLLGKTSSTFIWLFNVIQGVLESIAEPREAR